MRHTDPLAQMKYFTELWAWSSHANENVSAHFSCAVSVCLRLSLGSVGMDGTLSDTIAHFIFIHFSYEKCGYSFGHISFVVCQADFIMNLPFIRFVFRLSVRRRKWKTFHFYDCWIWCFQTNDFILPHLNNRFGVSERERERDLHHKIRTPWTQNTIFDLILPFKCSEYFSKRRLHVFGATRHCDHHWIKWNALDENMIAIFKHVYVIRNNNIWNVGNFLPN